MQTQFILDYAMTTSYRKFDRSALDVPAFQGGFPGAGAARAETPEPRYAQTDLLGLDRNVQELWPRRTATRTVLRLPTDLPNRIGGFSRLLDSGRLASNLPFTEQLGVLLTAAGRPIRWEPFSTYQVHRGIASARCLFLCSLRLAVRKDGSYELYDYDPNDHLLAFAGRSDDAAGAFCGKDFVIGIWGDLAKAVKPYGAFVPNLLGPESGLLQQQLALVGAALGWKMTFRHVFDARGAKDSLKLTEEGQLAIAIAEIEEPLFNLNTDDMTELSLTEPVPPRQELEAFPVLAGFQEAVESVGKDEAAAMRRLSEENRARPKRPPGAARTTEHDPDILEVVAKRNSGSYQIGFVPRPEPLTEAMLDTILRDWLTTVALQDHPDIDVSGVSAFCSVLRIKGERQRRCRIDFTKGSVAEIAEGDMIALFSDASTMPMANFRELNLVVTFACDFRALADRAGAASFLLAHEATGYLAGCFGMAAAKHGMFARPVRMYEDDKLEASLKLGAEPTIQLLCGFNRATRLCFEVG